MGTNFEEEERKANELYPGYDEESVGKRNAYVEGWDGCRSHMEFEMAKAMMQPFMERSEKDHQDEIESSTTAYNFNEPDKKEFYSITREQQLEMFDREYERLMKLPKESLVEMIIGKRHEVGMTFF